MQTSAFRISIPEPAIADLKERLGRTRWPDQLEDAGWDTGTELSYLKSTTDYWRDGFDLRRWTEMPRGGHFAAMEQPQLLADDVRAFFAGLV